MNFTPLSHSARKYIKLLHKKSEREKEQLLVCEGEKLCEEVLLAHAEIEIAVVARSASPSAIALAERISAMGIEVFYASDDHFAAISDAESPQGILAVVQFPHLPLALDKPFIALDGIADPGNVGTIIRTADWFGFRTVILGEGCADRFNPKTLRATMGSAFRVSTLTTSVLSQFLRDTFPKHTLYGATLEAKKTLEAMNPAEKFGIVFGNESRGISKELRSVLSEEFLIGGSGRAESLNVAISAGISMYRFSRP